VKIERRKKLTRAELAQITTSRPVVRRVLDRGGSRRPEKPHSRGPMRPRRRQKNLTVDSLDSMRRVRGG
jgi:hypothetical protein